MLRILFAAAGVAFALNAAPVAWADEPKPAAEPVATAAATSEDDEVVCKKVAVTGSRLQKEKICRTRAEWKAQSEGTKSTMRDIERQGATNLTPSGP